MPILTRQLQKLKGKKIKSFLLNPVRDGRGGTYFNPNIVMEDGTIIRFVVQETDVGEYGVEPVVIETKKLD